MDINKQIEKEAKYPSFQSIREQGANRVVDMKSYVDRVIGRELFEFGAKWMLEKWKDASRWRKVEEELPEFGSVIVAKGETYDFQDMYLLEIDSDYSMSVLTSYYKEWKPID